MSTRRPSALSARAPRDGDPGDAAFLAALYLSARPDLGALPVPASVIEGIARHQQAQQREAYARAWPHAEEWIVEDGEGPLGRLVLDQGLEALRVVDLSIAPRARRRGHARSLLLALQDEAAAGGRVLALRVRLDNAPARRLYAGLGFEALSSDGVHQELRWPKSPAK
ncbi:GNAT family N-acetyltransferase [Massilia sp. ST3]|uniref:GNAT family N-acetyltransferase n=1 Tax=Massilia sp. ST3 TaxID=2824903 RepID=UPI001B8338D2|nr:GNAT family N-acetyltransferase [Massilia sp. ST3]MBQ5946024.1 GNAT family N-acetyltransferase [Massilia sp. ST3]